MKTIYQTMLRLRQDCPWDKEQTHESLIKHLIEETYELVDAIESKDDEHLKEELGDVLLQVVFHAVLANERDAFTFDDFVYALNEKLIFRHPHVFGDGSVDGAEAAYTKWEESKQKEKARQSRLDGIPSRLPALARANKMQSKAAGVGFDWACAKDVKNKLNEELDEFDQSEQVNDREGMFEEIGDILFSVVNLARFYKIDPDAALRSTNQKFENRFRFIEQQVLNQGEELKAVSLEKMEQLWQQAKENE